MKKRSSLLKLRRRAVNLRRPERVRKEGSTGLKEAGDTEVPALVAVGPLPSEEGTTKDLNLRMLVYLVMCDSGQFTPQRYAEREVYAEKEGV